MPQTVPVLLPHPWLTIHPLYPGGFVPPLRPAAAAGQGMLGQAAAARLATDWAAARSAAEHAAAQAMESGSADDEADALGELAAAALLSGHADEAEAVYRRVLAADADRLPRFRAMVGLAAAAGARGDYEGGYETLRAALNPSPAMGDADHALVLANRSALLLGLGRLYEAEKEGAEALRAGRRMKDDYFTAIGGLAIGLAHLARGRRNDARSKLGDAVRLFARTGDVLRQVQCHHLLGEIAYDGEDPIRAGAHYRDGLGLARSTGAVGTVELLTLRFEHR